MTWYNCWWLRCREKFDIGVKCWRDVIIGYKDINTLIDDISSFKEHARNVNEKIKNNKTDEKSAKQTREVKSYPCTFRSVYGPLLAFAH